MRRALGRILVGSIVVGAIAIAALYAWQRYASDDDDSGLVRGNGRIEATEIDVAARIGGRIDEILVNEGDFVDSGDVLARMQVDSLRAQLDEARAAQAQAASSVDTAIAQVAMRESDIAAAESRVAQAESELDAARRRLQRSEALASSGAASAQQLDDDRARTHSARAGVQAAKAQVAAARAALAAARTQVIGARAAVTAAAATVARIQSEIDDGTLTAPRTGRVQYLIAQPGEVVAPGGKILNLVDLSDVYMNFFLPAQLAGRLAIGTEVRIVLDAAPQYVIPATVSFVASTAQFTPKSIETESEREKLMFRVKAQIPPELLRRHLKQVKTGLPGVAWIRRDSRTDWPQWLTSSADS